MRAVERESELLMRARGAVDARQRAIGAAMFGVAVQAARRVAQGTVHETRRARRAVTHTFAHFAGDIGVARETPPFHTITTARRHVTAIAVVRELRVRAYASQRTVAANAVTCRRRSARM